MGNDGNIWFHWKQCAKQFISKNLKWKNHTNSNKKYSMLKSNLIKGKLDFRTWFMNFVNRFTTSKFKEKNITDICWIFHAKNSMKELKRQRKRSFLRKHKRLDLNDFKKEKNWNDFLLPAHWNMYIGWNRDSPNFQLYLLILHGVYYLIRNLS